MLENRLYKALVAEEVNASVIHKIKELSIDQLPDSDVLIQVQYSSLNFKDALSATGNRGITKKYPHTPGIDSVGYVVQSRSAEFLEGDKVLVCGYDLGMNTPGGFGRYIRVPAQWIMHLPEKLSMPESMIIGTAGFTAGLAIHKMIQNGQNPDRGPVLVTGASGGLGNLAIDILHKNGFEVIAATGRKYEVDYLKSIGATHIFSREDVDDKSSKLLLKPQWAGAIDTVGGNILATAIKACSPHGNIACCGNANTYQLNTSVYPFILNGVNLLGIDSATCPMEIRTEIWNQLTNEWKPDHLDVISKTILLEDLPSYIDSILRGQIRGRVIIKHV